MALAPGSSAHEPADGGGSSALGLPELVRKKHSALEATCKYPVIFLQCGGNGAVYYPRIVRLPAWRFLGETLCGFPYPTGPSVRALTVFLCEYAVTELTFDASLEDAPITPPH